MDVCDKFEISSLFFFGQMSQENVFLNAIFEKTSSRLIEIWIYEDGKICIFPKGLVHGFLSKILNFLILFLDKLKDEKVSMMEKDPF